MSPAPAAIIEEHLNAAATLEYWLRCYPEWHDRLIEEPGATGPAISPGGYGGHVGHPTEAAAVERADSSIVVAAILAGLTQMPESLREVVELHYFSNVSQKRRKRNRALAHLLQASEIQALLTK